MNIIFLANFPHKIDMSFMGRFTHLAMLMYEKGHKVEVVCSDFDHATKDFRKELNNPYPFKLTFLHESGYPGNVSPKRLWSHYVWGKNVGKYLNSLPEKLDVIYSALPSFTAAVEAGKYCKKTGCKLIVDVQDLWPEAFKVKFKNPLIQMAFKPMECHVNRAYSAANLVIGCSDTYRDRGLRVNINDKEGLTVYLGNHGNVFDDARDQNNVVKAADEYWIAYIGTMGYSYDLKCAIDAIAKVNSKNVVDKKIRFVAMGGGPLLEEYKSYADEKQILSDYTGALAYPQMVGKLCSCDAVINCLRPGAAQSITNKVGDYALCGLPVINTQENEEYRKLVEEYQCGINCECGNSDEVADAIVRLMTDTVEARMFGANARNLGIERFDRRTTYPLIVNAIEELAK